MEKALHKCLPFPLSCLSYSSRHIGRDDSYSWAIAHEDGVEFEVDDHGDLEDAAAVLIPSDQFLAMMEGLGLDILALFHGSPDLMVRGLLSIFLLTPMTSSNNLPSNCDLPMNGSSIGSIDTISCQEPSYIGPGYFFTEPKRNHLFLYSFSR